MDFDDLEDLDPVEVADASTEEREFGVVVYGATGFLGGLVTERLDSMLSEPGASALSWAVAGRNLKKLRELARKCKSAPGVVQAEGPAELSQMAARARVVISCAGPYTACGEDIVRECVNQVTHYIDASGEVPWMQAMVNKYHAKAKEKGAMIVMGASAGCCLDELLCYSLARKLGPLRQFREYFRQRGGASGGSVDTEIAEMKAVTPERLGILCDPFCMGGARACGIREEEWETNQVAADYLVPGLWLAPTYAGVARSRLVRRSCALFEETPSDGVAYGEGLLVSARDVTGDKRNALQTVLRAGPILSVETAAGAAERLQFERGRGRLPESRTGPAPAARASDMTQAWGIAEGENGEWAYARCFAGCALEVTAAICVAGALVLKEELEAVKPKERGGVLSPAFAFHGSAWADRLKAGGSLMLEVVDGWPSPEELVGDSYEKPLYAQASPLWLAGWHMPFLDAPGEAGSTAWPTWEPMPQDRREKFPRAGLGAKPANMGEFKKVVDMRVPGEFWGIEFPFSPTQLQEMGPKWLTKALHTAGTMSKDNEIVEFTKFKVKAWDVTASNDPDDNDFGGAGCKVFLDVKYKNEPGELSEHMFIKMPHEFNGKNERFKNSMSSHQDWAEVMFYNHLGGRLPVRTPRGYFCDMSRKTTNFCMILEAIPYGDRWDREYGPWEILPNPAKYRDWTIPLTTRVDLYFAHARAQAQLYGWYHNNCSPMGAGKTDQVDPCFRDDGDIQSRMHVYNAVRPMSKDERNQYFLHTLTDPNYMGFVMGSGQPPNIAEGYVALAEDFVRKTAYHTFPREWTTSAYLDRWFSETKEMLPYLQEMGWYSQMTPEYFTLCHPNCMIDNAFYWRDDSGLAHCGLLDWGGCGHMSMPVGVAGCWIASEPTLLDEHEEGLLRCLLDEYEKVTGVKLDYDEFNLHLRLAYIAIHVGNCASVRWCTSIVPKEEWGGVEDRFDGKIDDGFMMRCYHVQTEFFLGMWQKRSPYPYFQEWMRRTGLPRK